MTWRGQWPPSAAGRAAARRRGQKGARAPYGSLAPSGLPQTLLCAATPFGRAAKRELRGLGSGRRFAFGRLSDPEFTLRKPQRCQCAARQCRAFDLCCEKLRFDQGLCLGAPNAPVGPSHLDARPQGVASKGRSGESRGDRKPYLVSCPLLPSAVGTASPPPKAATSHAMSWRTSLVPGGPISPAAASRRNGGKFRACLR